jgi:hypothetical protein
LTRSSLTKVKLSELAELPLLVGAGGIGSDVRGIALPVGVSVLLTTTGAGAFPHAAQRAHTTNTMSRRHARIKKADCILTDSSF